MEEIDLALLIERIRAEFGDHKPRAQELRPIVIAFGIGDAMSLASLLLGAWAFLFPRNTASKCPHKLYFARRACGLPLISVVYNDTTKELVMHCQNGHKTVQRTTRFYA